VGANEKNKNAFPERHSHLEAQGSVHGIHGPDNQNALEAVFGKLLGPKPWGSGGGKAVPACLVKVKKLRKDI